MADNQATIVLLNGESYQTPIENLENVRRLVKYKEIIFPGEEMEVRSESTPEIIEPKKRGPKPKQ